MVKERARSVYSNSYLLKKSSINLAYQVHDDKKSRKLLRRLLSLAPQMKQPLKTRMTLRGERNKKLSAKAFIRLLLPLLPLSPPFSLSTSLFIAPLHARIGGGGGGGGCFCDKRGRRVWETEWRRRWKRSGCCRLLQQPSSSSPPPPSCHCTVDRHFATLPCMAAWSGEPFRRV